MIANNKFYLSEIYGVYPYQGGLLSAVYGYDISIHCGNVNGHKIITTILV